MRASDAIAVVAALQLHGESAAHSHQGFNTGSEILILGPLMPLFYEEEDDSYSNSGRQDAQRRGYPDVKDCLLILARLLRSQHDSR
jgi:hypothetical protein